MDNLRINWCMTSDNITNMTDYIIARSISNNETLLKFNFDDNYKHFLEILSNDITEFTTFHSICCFLQHVSPDKKIREKCYLSDCKLKEYSNKLNYNTDIYNKICDFYKLNQKYLGTNSGEDDHFITFILKEYERNGIKLNDSNKTKLLKIKQEITKTENYIKNYIINDNKTISLNDIELEGLSNTFKNNLNKINNTNKYSLVLNKSTYNTCIQNINNSIVRKNIELIYSAKTYDIVIDIARLIVLRDKYAKILSYKNYSDYKTELNGAKNSQNVRDFLRTVIETMEYRYVKEVSTLKKIKNSDSLNSWDLSYYITKWRKEYGVNDRSISEYFPLKHVLQSILEIYSDLFQLKFTEIKNTNTWHPSVKTYSVIDNKTLQNIGFFYLDLYKREGKYDQMCCFVIRQPCLYPLYGINNSQTPIISLVASLGSSLKVKKNILLNHNEVVSLFHEFGHVMHNILGKTKYSLFSGTNVENDFVETPSQILEYLCWDKQILQKLSCHYKTKKCLPDHIINKMIKMRDLDIGIHYKKHCLIAIYDQLIHSSDPFIKLCNELIVSDAEVTKANLVPIFVKTYKQLHQQILCSNTNNDIFKIGYNDRILFPGVWINYLFSNNHLYYSKIWSKVYAGDIYNMYKTDIKELGNVIKNKILIYGGTKSSLDIMVDILGRKPNIDGFIKLHNLEQDEEFSYFFNTEHFENKNKSSNNEPIENYKYIDSDESITDTTSCSNRFSEIYIS